MNPSLSTTLTPDQLRGVTAVGKSLLLSAAAGSGKTRVLAERCAYLVCDAPDPYRCDVDELLVVTFTESAAAEMRDRIARVLSARLANASDERLAEQLALLEQAQISTLHSFCAQLLRQHFHVVGLDPGFSVMDEHEATLLRIDVCRELFCRRYAADKDGRFQRMVDGYADGNDERLREDILRLHSLLGSVKDPVKWLQNVKGRLERATRGKFSVSVMGQKITDLVRESIISLGEQCKDALELVNRFPDPKFKIYHARAVEVLQTLRHLYKSLQQSGIDAVSEQVIGLEFDRLSAVSNSVPNKSIVKGAIDGILKEFKKGGWLDFLQFKEAEWQAGLKMILPHVTELASLVDAFEAEYTRQKTDARQVDFNDLERLALRVLRDADRPGFLPSATARQYHRHFKHVLVDEYQDINEVQAAIIRLVSRECLYTADDEPAADKGKANPDAAQEALFLAKPQGNGPLATLPPNLFTVGDIKQSIYRFRLADITQFMDREKSLRSFAAGHGEVIDLRQNFRSRGPLLDAINAVFRRLMTKEAAEIDYDERHELVPGRDFPDAGALPVFSGSPIELHVLSGGGEDEEEGAGPSTAQNSSTPVSEHTCEDPDSSADAEQSGASRVRSDTGVSNTITPEPDLDRTEIEALFVAQRIRQIVGLDGGERKYVVDRVRENGQEVQKLRPAEFRDIVILLRSKKFKARQYVEKLESLGVPSHAESGDGFFESTEIRDMVALLSLLDNQQQDLELAAYLRSPLAGLKHAEDVLAAVRIAYRDEKVPVPFFLAVVRYSREKTDAIARQLKELLARLETLRERANHQPVHETIWQIYQETGYLAYVAGLPGGRQRSANLTSLYDRAREFSTFRRQGLGRFLDLLKTLEAETDIGQPSVLSEADNVVRIQSIHAAKGREYPIVFIPDCGKKFNRQDEAGSILYERKMGIGMAVVDEVLFAKYPSLTQVLVKDALRRKSIAEELRVLYVAMTRAMEHLILVGTAKGDVQEAWQTKWAGHAGKMPASVLLEASTMLGWLGPVWAAEQSAGAAIELTNQSAEEIARLSTPRERRAMPASLKALCERKPIGPAGSAAHRSDVTQSIIDRLTFTYDFDWATHQRATASVTSIAKGSGKDRSATEPLSKLSDSSIGLEQAGGPELPAALKAPAAEDLALPEFMSASPAQMEATDIGDATHLALQYLRFAGATDAPAITRQLDQMVASRQLRQEQRNVVDVEAILWFVQSDLGRLVVENEPKLMRELPVYFDAPPPNGSEAGSATGLDLMMVRGRLDLLVPLPAGGVLIDYKTDNVQAQEHIDQRVATYREQLHQYAQAMKRMTGQPIARQCLVFLRARRVVEV